MATFLSCSCAAQPKIQSFKEAQDSLTGIKEHHNTLYVR